MITGSRFIHDTFISNPKKLFLTDGLGACLTTFLLVALLARFEHMFGMPRTALYILSFVACLYAIYSICCHFFITGNWRPYLKGIAIANLIYCCITIGFIIYFFPGLTILGLIYFIAELIVISCLIYIELMTVSYSPVEDF